MKGTGVRNIRVRNVATVLGYSAFFITLIKIPLELIPGITQNTWNGSMSGFLLRLIMQPVVNGICYAIAGALLTLLYNYIAVKRGGIRVKVK